MAWVIQEVEDKGQVVFFGVYQSDKDIKYKISKSGVEYAGKIIKFRPDKTIIFYASELDGNKFWMVDNISSTDALFDEINKEK